MYWQKSDKFLWSNSLVGGVALFIVSFLLAGLWAGSAQAAAPPYRLGVLLVGDNRQEPFAGLQEGLAEHRRESGVVHLFEVRNAQGERKLLPELARELVAARPDVLIAGGGVEADALRTATAGTDIPVVFLAVSSAVARGLAQSMLSSGNNFTGIDTNDTELTEKRLWLLQKIFPQKKRITILNMPSIPPSVKSCELARQVAPALGQKVTVIDVENAALIGEALARIDNTNCDLLLLVPVPWDKTVLSNIFADLRGKGIPVMGFELAQIESGATFAYAASRFAAGKQATRLVHKILHGTAPRDIPLETPDKIEFIINRRALQTLGLTLPRPIWKMADQVVDQELN
ncbi:MAG: ABC transporter substrate-binding protein [Deltaproteobacteria bacterium]|nr:ABC transporter substrate-binding protein [Deltaproteobacteria bacterium]